MSAVQTHQQKEKYIVNGFIRKVTTHKIVPNDIVHLIKLFAHNKFYYLYKISGEFDRNQLQIQIMKDIIVQTQLNFKHI